MGIVRRVTSGEKGSGVFSEMWTPKRLPTPFSFSSPFSLFVRYVTLPYESHGYQARESVEHTLYEMISWFDKYVKNAPAAERGTSSP